MKRSPLSKGKGPGVKVKQIRQIRKIVKKKTKIKKNKNQAR